MQCLRNWQILLTIFWNKYYEVNIMWGYITTFIGGVSIGILVDKLVEKEKQNSKLKFSEALEVCFGTPVYTNLFTINDVRDWIKTNEKILGDEAKAIIMRARPDILKVFESRLDFSNGIENTLVLAIVNGSEKKIKASLLVKYDKLDEILDAALAKGDGVMVVEK